MADDWLRTRLIPRPRWHAPVEGRTCIVHPERPAQDRCDHCARPYCAVCLHHLARWRVCLACRDLLERQRTGPTSRQRWERLRPTLLAIAAMLALCALVLVSMDRLLGGPSDQELAVAGVQVGSRLHGQPPVSHAALRLVVPLPTGSPPAVITIAGSGFQADERVEATATLAGATTGGRPLTEKLDTHVYGPVDGGNLLIKVAVSDPLTIAAPYHLHLTASGDQGSDVALDATGGS